MLRKLDFKGVYKSDQDHILADFYFPTLSVAQHYDRAVGYFSASAICLAAQALSVFVQNGGEIRLILGAFSEQEDLEAIKEGYKEKQISEKIGNDLLSIISDVSDELFQNRFETLAWLVAHGRLEVKIALRAHGMYHDKIGIISDEMGDKVVFSGSANESTHALLPSHNYESITVFRTWIPEHFEFFNPHIESFERLWRNESHSTVVIDIPTAVKEKLITTGNSLDHEPDPNTERDLAARLSQHMNLDAHITSGKPRKPDMIYGHPFKMRDHQLEALRAWKAEGDFQGILALATGAGKTITAIHAIVTLSEKYNGLVCIIAVPYQNLANQWVKTLSVFNIYPVKCYISQSRWKERLRRTVHELTISSRDFAAIVVVNRTLKSSEFQDCLSQIDGDRLFWIGDECHHHTSETFGKYLPFEARFRLGLSATPEHYLDETRNERLNDFYGGTVYSYSLKQAIEDGILTPYEYHPHIVELTQDEAERFVDLSAQIGQIRASQGNRSNDISSRLTSLLMKRARLTGAATNKLPMLQSVLLDKEPTKYTLFYCGDGTVETDGSDDFEAESFLDGKRQVDAISTVLHEMSWNVSRFTSRESHREREDILNRFQRGIIDAMVAIRCLDEGIDVPACSTAYILASARDPRQFIQRRGRILRRSPGKELAVIHDFIVVLPQDFDTDSEYARRLIKRELIRVAEFSSLSKNRAMAYEKLAPVLQIYDLEHMM